MAELIWLSKIQMCLGSDGYWYLGVSEVADYELSFKISKFKMTDQNIKTSLILIKTILWRLQGLCENRPSD